MSERGLTLKIWLAMVTIIFLTFQMADAQTSTFTGTGNFSNPGNWNGSTLPVAGNNLVINGTCTFDNAANLYSYGTLTVGSASAGTLNWPVGGTNTLEVTTVSSGLTGSSIDMTNGGTLSLSSTWTTTNLSFTPGTGTVNYSGTTQTVAAYTSYYNLELSTASATNVTKSFTATTTSVAGAFTLSTSGAGTLTSKLLISMTVTGTLNVGSGCTLNLNTFNETVGSITGAGTIDNQATGTPLLTTGSDNTNTAFSGTIKNTSLTLSLYKVGTGTLTLTGTNAYNGNTTISAGTIIAGASNACGTVGAVILGDASTAANNSSPSLLTGAAITFPLAITVANETTTGTYTIGGNTANASSFTGGITISQPLTITQVSGATLTLSSGSITGGTSGSLPITVNNMGAVTISKSIGNGSGTVSVTEQGTDILTLSAGNSFSGGVNVNFGTLKLGGTGSVLGALAGTTTVASGAVLDLNGFISTATNPIALSGTGLTSSPAGALTNTGAAPASYTGNITLGTGGATITATTSGTLTVGLNGGTISGAGQPLILNGAGTGSIPSVIGTTTGTVTMSGTGTWTFSANNTYTGSTTVNSGTLAAGNTPKAFGTLSAVIVNSPGILNLSGENETIGSLSGNGTIDNTSGAGTYTLTNGGDNSNTTFSGIIQNTSGTVAITKAGAGLFNLSGNNTFKGLVTVSAGTLQPGATGTSPYGPLGTLAASPNAISITSGAVLDLNGYTLAVIPTTILSLNGPGLSTAPAGALTNTGGNASYTGPITIATAATITTTAAGTLTVGAVTNNANTVTLDGAGTGYVTGVIGASVGGVTKNGAGTWTLSGSNSYDGITTVNNGVLAAGIATAAFGTASKMVINSPGVVDMAGFNETIASLAGSGTIDNNINALTGTYTLTTGSNTTATNFSGTIQNTYGSIALVKLGVGNQTLSGTTSTYTGTTTIQAGRLSITSLNSVSGGSASSSLGTPTSVANGTITLGSAADASLIYIGSGQTTDRVINLASTGTSLDTIEADGTGPINFTSNLTITVSGAKTLFLQGSNTGNNTFAGLIADNTTGGTFNTTITKTGAGTWMLSGNNSYSGITNVLNGTLRLGANGTSPDGPLGDITNGTTVSSGAVFDLNGYTLATLEPLTINGAGLTASPAGVLTNTGGNASYSGTITLAGATTITNTTSGTLGVAAITGSNQALTLDGAGTGSVTGAIANAASLTKNGAGSWTLSGANSYTGATTISAGTLIAGTNAPLSANGAFGSAATAITMGNANTTTNGSSPALLIGGAFTIARPITVASQSTTGTYSIGGSTDNNSTFSGAITINEPLTISQVPNTGTNTLTISGGISSVGSMGVTTQGGGTVTMAVANSYTGGTTINSGTLALGIINGLPTTSPVTLNGGTFSAGAGAGFKQTNAAAGTGTVDLTTSSNIQLGTSYTASILTFSNSSAITWTAGDMLTIYGWTGGAGGGRLYFGNSSSGLTSGQVAQIQFNSGTISSPGTNTAAQILGTGEITETSAEMYRSFQTGNWSSASSWQVSSNGGATWAAASLAPNSTTATSVEIQSAHTITLDMAETIDEVTVDASGTLALGANTLTLNHGTSPDLLINGTLTVSTGAIAPAASAVITINGTLTHTGTTTSAVAATGASTIVNVNGLFQTANTTTVTGGFSGAAAAAISTTNTPTINLGSSSTIEYNGAAQTITRRTDYANVIASGSNTKTTPTSGFTLSGNLTVQTGATLTDNAQLISVSGSGQTFYLNGTGAYTMTLASANPLPAFASYSFGPASTVTQNAAINENVAALTYGNLFLANPVGNTTIYTRTMLGSVTVAGTLTVSNYNNLIIGVNTLTFGLATAPSGSNGNLVVGGTSSIITGGATSNMVFNDNAAGNATNTSIPTITSNINNLTINRANGVSNGTTNTVSGVLTLTQGSLTLASGTLTLNGTITGSGTFFGTNGSLTLGGSGAMGTLNFAAGGQVVGILTMNMSSGGSVILGSNLSVTSFLILTSGIINEGANVITVTGTGAGNVQNSGGANSYVNGALARTFATSSTGTNLFPIGNGAYNLFELINLVVSSGTVTITVGTNSGSFTSLNNGLGEDVTGANQYWSATVSGSGTLASMGVVQLTPNTTPLATNNVAYSVNNVNGAYNSGTYNNGGGSISAGTISSIASMPGGYSSNYFAVGGRACLGAGATPTTYSIGPTGTFGSLGEVAAVLSSGYVCGNLIFEFQPTYSSSVESFPIPFSAFNYNGTGTWTVLIRPNSSVSSALSITGSSATQLINLNGASNLTFDGRPGSTGTNQYLGFSNTNTSGTTFQFINDANSDTLKYLSALGVNTSATNGTIALLTAAAGGNSNNTITNCSIGNGASAPANGIYSSGTSIHTNSSNTITYNNIYNFTTNGVYLNSSGNGNGNSWNISHNSFYNSGVISTTITAINVTPATTSGGHTIFGNFVGGQSANAGGSAWTMTGSGSFTGIQIDVASTPATTVDSNIIQNIASASQLSFAGISVTGFGGRSLVDIGLNKGNIIGSSSSATSIQCTNTNTALTTVTGILLTTTTSASAISNNFIGGINYANSQYSQVTGVSVTAAGTTSATLVQNNTIKTLALGNSLSGVSYFKGINIGTGLYTVYDNTIGDPTLTNYASITASGSTANTSSCYGIYSSSATSPLSITSNRISNITLSGNPGTSLVTGYQVAGIYHNGAATLTVTGNNVIYLSNNWAISDSTSAAGLIGIALTTSAASGHTVSGNTVYALTNPYGYASSGTITNNITGIYYAPGSGGSGNLVNGNLVHSLDLTYGQLYNTSITGIRIVSGNSTISNNMVRLGVNTDGSPDGNIYTFTGIYDMAGTNNYYFNSVYIGGVDSLSSGAYNNTFAFNSTVTSGTRNIEDNIFFNGRTEAAPGGYGHNYAMQVGSLSGLSSDYNDLYVNGGTGVIATDAGGTDYSTLQAWQTATGDDGHSISMDPLFINEAGTAATVSLDIQPCPALSPIDGAGSTIASVTTDFNGNLRSSYPANIGADATSLCNFYITYPLLTGVCSSSSTYTTPNFVTVNTTTGVDIATGSNPRLYYKLPAAPNTSTGWNFVTASNGSSPFSFNIDLTVLGTLTPGELIQFFVVAQDATSDSTVAISSGTLAGNPRNGTNTLNNFSTWAFPVTGSINTFQIVPCSGTVTVGAGGTYAAFTTATGLFQAINAATLSGNVTVNVLSDVSIEDGTNALNQWAESGVGGYKLIVQPSSATNYTISGSYTGTNSTNDGLFRINGADRLMINGSYGGSGNYLLFRNNNSGAYNATLTLMNDATNDTFAYCSFEGGSLLSALGTSNTDGVIYIAGTNLTTGNFNNTFTYCNVSGWVGSGSGAQYPINGFYSQGTIGKANASNTIDHCNVYNFDWGNNGYTYSSNGGQNWGGVSGINVTGTGNGNHWQITNNSIYRSSTGGSSMGAVTGINFFPGLSSNGNIISGNYIGGSAAGATGTWPANSSLDAANSYWVGIAISVDTGAATNVTNNVVSGVSTNASNPSGILYNGEGTVNIGNGAGTGNTVSNITASSVFLTGILNGAGNGSLSILNNTVSNIGSSATSSGTGSVIGIRSTFGKAIVNNNTISGLNSVMNVSAGGDPVGAEVIGLWLEDSVSASGNNVYNLAVAPSGGTAAAGVTGIEWRPTGLNNNILEKNFVHSLSLTTSSTSGLMTGIAIGRPSSTTGADATVRNNMVQLGIDSNGTNITNAVQIVGISKDLDHAVKTFFNSVYIGGTGVSSGVVNTMAFNYQLAPSNSEFDSVYDNIFVNARSNASTGGNHFAIQLGTQTTQINSDYNIYSNYNTTLSANGTGGLFGAYNSGANTVSHLPLLVFTPTFATDMFSGYGNPNFIAPTGNSATVNLNLSNATPAEGSGVLINSVVTDINGNIRANYTPIDIGADAGNFNTPIVASTDVFAPVMVFTPLPNQGTCASSTKLTVTITDVGTGVPTASGNLPTVWFRRTSPVATAWGSTAGVLTSGNGNNGVWTFTFNYSAIGLTGPSVGETYQYYVVAEDQATNIANGGNPNIGYSPYTINQATNSSTSVQVSPPGTPSTSGTPYSYTIVTSTPPTVYNVTGGTNCSPSTIGLNNSDAGVTYQLMLNDTNTGSPVAGVSGALSFGPQTAAGTYTVIATNSVACTSNMTGSAVVIAAPIVYNVTGSGCAPAAIGLDNSQSGVNYQLQLNHVNIGSAIAGTGSPLTWLNQTSTGNYGVVATNTSTSCSDTMNGLAVLTACSFTWTGATSNDWSTSTNWSPADVPNSCGASVIINSGTPVISASDISVGDITIGGGVTLALNGMNLNVCGSWTGGVSSDALVTGSGTTFLNGSSAQTISGNTQFNILQINNGSGVSLASRATVSIGSGLQLQNGALTINTGTVHLLSTAANNNSYIDDFSAGFDGTVSGNVIMDRYVPISGYNQHFISSPLGGVELSQVGASGPNGSFVIPSSDCNETQSAGNSPYGSVFTYVDGHEPSGGCMLGNWMVTTAGDMLAAKGYSTYLTGNSTLSVTGSANTGNMQATNLNNSGYPTVNTFQGAPIQSGWNLVGNPYPSAVNLNLANNRSSYGFSGIQVQLWQTTGPFAGSWQTGVITENGLFTIDDQPMAIAPFQAFMVRVDTLSPGLHSYPFFQNERVRTTDVPFYRVQSENKLILELDYNGAQDMTAIAFNPSATYGFDPQYDADKSDGNQARPTLYSYFNSAEWYSLNTLPALTQTAAVPVGLRPNNTGTMTLIPQGIQSFDPTTYIYLEDTKTGGAWQNLRNGAYTFTAATTDNQQRFVLHFTPPAIILTQDASCETPGMINIRQPGSANWTYTVTDNNNVAVSTGVLNAGAPVMVNVNAGVYTLTLTDNNGYTVVKNLEVGGTQPVTASFGASANTAQTQQNITFTGGVDNVATYSWDYGDGTTGSGQQVSHSYQTQGVYTVKLNVTSGSGCVAATSQTVTITSRSATGISNVSENSLNIWSYENRVFVDFTRMSNVDAEVQLYNVLGQMLSDERFGRSTVYSKRLINMDAAYVIVKVINDGQVTTKKVFIANGNK